MNQHEIMMKLTGVKSNFQNLIRRFRGLRSDDEELEIEMHENGEDNFIDDLPLTFNRDPSPGVKYYTTENSEFSRGAGKEIPRGIDSFGEEDTFDFEEADDFQTNRDRKQNSDLSKRFYTDGLDVDEFNRP